MGGMIDAARGMQSGLATARQTMAAQNPLVAALRAAAQPTSATDQPAAGTGQATPVGPSTANVTPSPAPQAPLRELANPTPSSVSGGALRGTKGSSAEAYAYNYYLKQGLPPAMAAGLVGNAMQESAFRGDVITGNRKGDNGASGYAYQWQGKRQRNLMRFAASRGETTPSLDTQLQFALEEGNPQSPYADAGAVKAIAQMRNTNDPEQAAIIFRNLSERPSAQDHAKRAAYARRIFGGTPDPNMVAPTFEGGSAVAGGGSSTATGGLPTGNLTTNPADKYNSRMFGGGGSAGMSAAQGEEAQSAEPVDTGAPLVESAQQQIAQQSQPSQRSQQRKEELRKRSHSTR